MKKVFLLIALPALLLAPGFAQTPDVANSNPTQTTTAAAASAPAPPVIAPAQTVPDPAAAPVVAPAAPVAPANTIPETAVAPPAPDARVSTPAQAPAAPVIAPAAPVIVPAPPTVEPKASVSTTSDTETAPRPARASARARKEEAQSAAATTPDYVAPQPAAAADAPAATAVTTASAVPDPDAKPAAIPAKPMTAISGSVMVTVIVVVLAFGALVPLFVRWRKRKLLEETAGENLSLTHDTVSDELKREQARREKSCLADRASIFEDGLPVAFAAGGLFRRFSFPHHFQSRGVVMDSQVVKLQVSAGVPIDCEFWSEDDGWKGLCKSPSVTVHGSSFEDAKKNMAAELQALIENILSEHPKVA